MRTSSSSSSKTDKKKKEEEKKRPNQTKKHHFMYGPKAKAETDVNKKTKKGKREEFLYMAS